MGPGSLLGRLSLDAGRREQAVRLGKRKALTALLS
jgi:hypothetical protein